MRGYILPLSLVTLVGCSGADKIERPNVIVILSDDQGYGDFSCHGNPVIKTPNLDKLHERSVRLTEFHVAPVSTPTRGELLTGRCAMHNGAWSWAYGQEVIDPNIPTIANAFAQAGYSTAHFGKWHLGDNYPFRPQDKGFEESIRLLGAASHQTPDYWQNDNFDDFYKLMSGESKQFEGFCTDVWFDMAMNHMKSCKESEKPFFIYLPLNAAHVPLYVEERYSAPYREYGNAIAKFFGLIANIDENIGRLDSFLSQERLDENTIVIYMSDNGGTVGTNIYNGNRRGKKGHYYDGGHRAPCFIKWGGGELISPQDIGELTSVQDILPTLVDLCGIDVVDKRFAQIDGISLADRLTGKVEVLGSRKLVVQFSTQPKPKYGESAVLWDDWRMVANRELYNIKNDPCQQHDLAQEHPEILSQLQQYYKAWWATTLEQTSTFHRVIVGGAENPTAISCFDWTERTSNDNVTEQKTIWEGAKVNGMWYMKAAQAGEYRISLRRYPIEADCAISASYPATQREFAYFKECEPLPIAMAAITIGDQKLIKQVGSTDKEVVFNVTLAEGNFNLSSTFYDKSGEAICGAYYAYIEKL